MRACVFPPNQGAAVTGSLAAYDVFAALVTAGYKPNSRAGKVVARTPAQGRLALDPQALVPTPGEACASLWAYTNALARLVSPSELKCLLFEPARPCSSKLCDGALAVCFYPRGTSAKHEI